MNQSNNNIPCIRTCAHFTLLTHMRSLLLTVASAAAWCQRRKENIICCMPFLSFLSPVFCKYTLYVYQYAPRGFIVLSMFKRRGGGDSAWYVALNIQSCYSRKSFHLRNTWGYVIEAWQVITRPICWWYFESFKAILIRDIVNYRVKGEESCCDEDQFPVSVYLSVYLSIYPVSFSSVLVLEKSQKVSEVTK